MASTHTTPLDPNAPSAAQVFFDSNVTTLSHATPSSSTEALDLVPSVGRGREGTGWREEGEMGQSAMLYLAEGDRRQIKAGFHTP